MIITGDGVQVYICDITAFVLVRYRIAARPNSELRQKVLDLVLVSIKNGSLGLGLGLEMQDLALGLGLDKKSLIYKTESYRPIMNSFGVKLKLFADDVKLRVTY